MRGHKRFKGRGLAPHRRGQQGPDRAPPAGLGGPLAGAAGLDPERHPQALRPPRGRCSARQAPPCRHRPHVLPLAAGRHGGVVRAPPAQSAALGAWPGGAVRPDRHQPCRPHRATPAGQVEAQGATPTCPQASRTAHCRPIDSPTVANTRSNAGRTWLASEQPLLGMLGEALEGAARSPEGLWWGWPQRGPLLPPSLETPVTSLMWTDLERDACDCQHRSERLLRSSDASRGGAPADHGGRPLEVT
jgi:hypothetical protein